MKNGTDEVFWKERDGIIYFPVTFHGETHDQMINSLESKKILICNPARQFFQLNKSKLPKKGQVCLAVMRGSMFSSDDRTTLNIRREAKLRKMIIIPYPQIACLIRRILTRRDIKKMDMRRIVLMHRPIKDFNGDRNLLCIHSYDQDSWLGICKDDPKYSWDYDDSFAFIQT